MNISIGILAHNESSSIVKTLESLFKQSLFNQVDGQDSLEIIVVPNGCTDDTAEVSAEILTNLVQKSVYPNLEWKVCPVSESGKSRAWNFFIHEFSNPDADFVFLMDADIQFLETVTLQSLLDLLKQQSEVEIALDRPIKDVAIKKNKNLLEKLSVAVSRTSNAGPLYICGQLYCGRASALRKIWLPIGLPVEDGFLTAMIVNNRFISSPAYNRIACAKSASHIFKAYVNPSEFVAHEIRIVMGIVINIYLSEYLRSKCNERQDAGCLIKNMNKKNPLWLKEFIEDTVAIKGWWIIPLSFVFRRFRALQHHSLLKAILLAPIATVAFLVDLPIFVQANYKLVKGVGFNYW